MPRATRSHSPSSTSTGKPARGAGPARTGSRRRAAAGRPACRPTRPAGRLGRGSPVRARRPAARPGPARVTRASGVAGDGVDEPRRPLGQRRRRPFRPTGRRRRLGARGEPPPGHLAGQAQLVEPPGVVAGHPGREDLALPVAGRHLHPRQLFDDGQQPGPALGRVPGATCCQRARNRTKSAMLAGSTPRRRRPRLAACSRTSRWRAHQRPSGSSMAEPSASRRARPVRARATSPVRPGPSRRAAGASATSSSTETGPASSRWPRTHSATASSSSAGSVRRPGLGQARRSVGAQAPATMRPGRRPRAASNQWRQAGTGRHRTKDSRRSWSSSGSRGPGPDLVQHLGRPPRRRAGPARRPPPAARGPGPERPEPAAHRHRPGAALLERGAVQEGVGPAGQDPVGQRRGLGRLDAGGPDPAVLEAASRSHQARRRRAARSGSRPPSGAPGRGRGPAPARGRRSPGRRPGPARRRPAGRRPPCAGGGWGGAARRASGGPPAPG